MLLWHCGSTHGVGLRMQNRRKKQARLHCCGLPHDSGLQVLSALCDAMTWNLVWIVMLMGVSVFVVWMGVCDH